MSEGVVDHVGLKVTDFGVARAFYQAALGTLGIQLLTEFEAGGKRLAGFGRESRTPTFWISSGKLTIGEAHVAFLARSRTEVSAFYTVALATGGRDNGPPGLRPHYHPNYYGAFVLDPDGHNIEAVCHGAD